MLNFLLFKYTNNYNNKKKNIDVGVKISDVLKAGLSPLAGSHL